MPDRRGIDSFEIPPALDRRGESSPRAPAVTARKRNFIMPSARRVRAMKRQRERETAAIRRATERDLRTVAPETLIDAAADVARKQK